MGKFQGLRNDFREELERELTRVENLKSSNPAIVLLRLKDSSQKEKVEGTLYEIAMSVETDFSVPGVNKQGLDYVATFQRPDDGNYIGILLFYANGKVAQVTEKIMEELRSRCGYKSLDDVFDHIGTASYEEGSCEKVDDLIKAALK